jgi:hypothetical protein
MNPIKSMAAQNTQKICLADFVMTHNSCTTARLHIAQLLQVLGCLYFEYMWPTKFNLKKQEVIT